MIWLLEVINIHHLPYLHGLYDLVIQSMRIYVIYIVYIHGHVQMGYRGLQAQYARGKKENVKSLNLMAVTDISWPQSIEPCK